MAKAPGVGVWYDHGVVDPSELHSFLKPLLPTRLFHVFSFLLFSCPSLYLYLLHLCLQCVEQNPTFSFVDMDSH